MIGRLPDFVIVGAMRSGTTSLSRYLGGHPQVFLHPEKELHFFDENWEKGPEWYASRFAAAPREAVAGEGTPIYMYDPSIADRMASTIPNAKLVAVLRNPVDRAYSHYWHGKHRGRDDLTFAEAIAAEPARLATGDEFARRHHSYLDRGRYLSQLQRLRERMPGAPLAVTLFEELRDRPADVVARICRHLDVDPDRAPAGLGRSLNPGSRPRSVRLHHAAANWPPPLRKAVRSVNRVREDYPPMDADLRRALLARFREENAALAAWLGVDLSAWDR